MTRHALEAGKHASVLYVKNCDLRLSGRHNVTSPENSQLSKLVDRLYFVFYCYFTGLSSDTLSQLRLVIMFGVTYHLLGISKAINMSMCYNNGKL